MTGIRSNPPVSLLIKAKFQTLILVHLLLCITEVFCLINSAFRYIQKSQNQLRNFALTYHGKPYLQKPR
jgi:hypothetical protein